MASAMLLAAHFVSFRGKLLTGLALLLCSPERDMYSMTTDSKLQAVEPELIRSVPPDHPIADLTLRALATVSDPFRLYRYHVNGLSAEQIAVQFDMPVSSVEQRIEAARLCVQHQLAFAFDTGH
jgi:hypothetical protein